MSPDASARRLRTLARLHRLASSLKQVRILGPIEPPAEADPRGGTGDRTRVDDRNPDRRFDRVTRLARGANLIAHERAVLGSGREQLVAEAVARSRFETKKSC